MIASVRQPLNDYDFALGQEYSKILFMRSKLPDWEGTEKAIATYPESGSSGGHQASKVRFSKSMAMYWLARLALAYANQRNQDLALSCRQCFPIHGAVA